MDEIYEKNKIYRGARAFFGFMCAAVIGCMAAASAVLTVYYPPDYSEVPFIEVSVFPALAGTAVLLLCAVLAYGFGLFKQLNIKHLTCFMAAFAVIFGALWVVFAKDTPGSDMALVCENAEKMAAGDFSMLRPLAYFSQFPFQLGIGTVIFIFMLIFGENYQLAFQLANVFCAAVMLYYLAHITDLLFKSRGASVLVRLLLMLCTPVFLCCTLLYGNIISPMFCVMALFYALGASSKKHGYLLAVICMAFGYLCKPNALIFAIGIAIYLVFQAIARRKVLPVATAVCIFAAMWLSGEGMLNIYENVSGYDLHSGMPKTAWIAMGLQEGPLAPGWFNSYTDSIYIANGGDEAEISAEAMSSIKSSVKNFVQSPGYTLRFFGQKAIIQWCEPTYSGFWVSAPDVVHGEDGGLRAIITLLYFGQLHDIAVFLMDTVQLLFYGGAAYCIWRNFKRLTIAQLTPAIIILGGVAYHLLSESKCLYALPYYVLFVPYAAFGIYTLCGDIGKRFKISQWRKK